MHSSRMHTVRSSGHILGGVSAPGGCLLGGVCSWGVSALGGFLLWEGGLLWVGLLPGGLLGGGGVVSQHALRQTRPPPSVDREMPVKT